MSAFQKKTRSSPWEMVFKKCPTNNWPEENGPHENKHPTVHQVPRLEVGLCDADVGRRKPRSSTPGCPITQDGVAHPF